MRQDKIYQYFQNEIIERKRMARQFIEDKYKEKGSEYKNVFSEILEKGFKEFIENQKSNKEKKMKYIQVNCLRVALETKTYEYSIRIMDENGYWDKEMIELDYIPSYMENLIAIDCEYFSKLIMSKVIRAKKYEVKDFLRKYIWETYIKPIPLEIDVILSSINNVKYYDVVVRAEEVEVSYGEMLEVYDKYWLFE